MSIGLLYEITFENVATGSGVEDILVIAAGSGVPLIVHSIRATTEETTDIRARVQILRRSTAGSGGTGITPKPTNPRNTVAAACTVTRNRTTPGTAGDLLDSEKWSIMLPFERIYAPSKRIYVPSSGILCFALLAALPAAKNVSLQATIEEL